MRQAKKLSHQLAMIAVYDAASFAATIAG